MKAGAAAIGTTDTTRSAGAAPAGAASAPSTAATAIAVDIDVANRRIASVKRVERPPVESTNSRSGRDRVSIGSRP
ncbi:hypothetical protein GCM10009773_40550 [Williamsia serinedens]